MTSPTFGQSPKPRAIIAAAERKRLDRFQRVGEPWQPALWDIYTHLGPVHYGMTFKQSAAQRVDYFAAERDEAQNEPVPTDNPQVIEAVERLGDLSAIVGEFVVQENVAGEGYLHGNEDDDRFEVLSTVEVQARQDTRDGSSLGEYLLRIWRPSPQKRSEPDSSLRSVQAQCEQLLLLNDQVTSTAMSRIPAGFLLVASEMSFASPAEDAPDTGANIDNDPFMEEIVDILTLAVQDPDSAARIAPNVIRGPYEMIKDGFRYVDISRSMDETFAKMREELLRQIAGGINLPAEILTGLADLNHWSLWGVDESTAKHHVDPDVLQILQGLTEGYLWPYLEEAGMSRDEAKRYVIWRDYSDLTARPMTVEQALALNVEGIINDEYVRKVANVPDEYAGEGVKSAQAINPEPEALRDPPVVAAAVDIRPLVDIDRSTATQIIEASEAAFTRALERAGAKIRTKTKKNPQMHAAIDGVANELVPRTLGERRVEQLQLTPDQLLPADTFDQLESRMDTLIRRGQDETRGFLSRLFGKDVVESDEETDRRSAIAAFIAALFTAATARLFTDSPAPDPAETGEFSDDIATGQMVVNLLTEAGGGTLAPDTPRGLALGQRTRAAFRDNGYRVESLTWQWGYYRTPTTPYEPHQSKDGDRVLGREDPRLGGYYPGDHRFCACELVPTVLPV